MWVLPRDKPPEFPCGPVGSFFRKCTVPIGPLRVQSGWVTSVLPRTGIKIMLVPRYHPCWTFFHVFVLVCGLQSGRDDLDGRFGTDSALKEAENGPWFYRAWRSWLFAWLSCKRRCNVKEPVHYICVCFCVCVFSGQRKVCSMITAHLSFWDRVSVIKGGSHQLG